MHFIVLFQRGVMKFLTFIYLFTVIIFICLFFLLFLVMLLLVQ